MIAYKPPKKTAMIGYDSAPVALMKVVLLISAHRELILSRSAFKEMNFGAVYDLPDRIQRL